MSRAYAHDKSWSDRCLPELKRIAGELLVSVAPLHVDQRQNTDLLVLTLNAQTIACRVRRQEVVLRYPYHVTFRCERPSGADTEYEKMTVGQWGDLMIYGFADDLGHVFRWAALDLKRYRGEAMRALMDQNTALRNGERAPPPLTQGPVRNPDGTKFFYVDTRDERVRRCVVRCDPKYWNEEAAA